MKERFGDRFQVLINPDYNHLGCFCTIDPESNECVFEWQILSARHYLEGYKTSGYGFTYTNRALCQKLARIFSEIADVTSDLEEGYRSANMSVERLKSLQKMLWGERVRRMKANIEYNPPDPELREAFVKRGVNRKNFDLNEMDFRETDFPSVPYPIVPRVQHTWQWVVHEQ